MPGGRLVFQSRNDGFVLEYYFIFLDSSIAVHEKANRSDMVLIAKFEVMSPTSYPPQVVRRQICLHDRRHGTFVRKDIGAVVPVVFIGDRSEERRVGKE